MRAGQPARAARTRPPASMLQAIRSRAGSLVVKGAVRSPDPDLRGLGHRRYFPQPPDRYGHRHRRRPEHPGRGIAGGRAAGARSAKRRSLAPQIDLQQAKQLGIIDTILEALDRPQPRRSRSRADCGSTSRMKSSAALSPTIRDFGRPTAVSTALFQCRARPEPPQRGPICRNDATRHSTQ